MDELGLFADRAMPCHLWRGGGAFSNLFLFVAPRCLANGDSVVPVEGIHGRWKRFENKSLKLPLLNGYLKVHFAAFNDGFTDDVDALVPHYQLGRAAHRREYEAVLNLGEVPPGMRQDAIYLQRFNLRSSQAYLLHGGVGRDRPVVRSSDIHWEVYCRKLLAPSRFYSFSALSPNRFMYVVASRAFAGRDTPGDDDTHGQPLSVAWFERTSGADDDCLRVRRADAEADGVAIQRYTIAELIRAAGLFVVVAETDTARDHELKLQRDFLRHDLSVYEHAREVLADHGSDEGDAFEFILSNPTDVEVALWDSTDVHGQTNLALARRQAV